MSTSNHEKLKQERIERQRAFRRLILSCNIELKALVYKLDVQQYEALAKARKAKQENNQIQFKGMKNLLAFVIAQQASVRTMQNNLEILSIQMEVNDSILDYTKSLEVLAKIAREQNGNATPNLTKLSTKASTIFSAIATKVPDMIPFTPVADITPVSGNFSAISERDLDALIDGIPPVNDLSAPIQTDSAAGTMDEQMADILGEMGNIGSDAGQ